MAVGAFPQPATKKQVHAFLGLAGYYCHFVPNFSTVASPLSDLTRKGGPDKVRWMSADKDAFTTLKKALTSSPVLRNLDFDLPFLVHTDASEMGFGAVLSQVFKGEDRLTHRHHHHGRCERRQVWDPLAGSCCRRRDQGLSRLTHGPKAPTHSSSSSEIH